MPLDLTLVSDKAPQEGGWYNVQNLNEPSGYMIAKYIGADEYKWKQQSTDKFFDIQDYPWYSDNPLVNVKQC